MAVFHIVLFAASALGLTLAGNWLVAAFERIARYFAWREFVAAFFIMSFAVSVPEIFIGVSSAIRGIPELSFGNIIGANVVHFTLAIALGTLFMGGLDVHSKMAQTSGIFAIAIAVLPALLILDGNLSRIDGGVLILFFAVYSFWLFSKEQRFSRVYRRRNSDSQGLTERGFMRDAAIFAGGAALLGASSQGIIVSARFFADALGIPLVVVGILIVGLGTALPETYFAIVSARHGHSWMIVGNLLGATAFTASFVLGLVALIRPIVIDDFSPYVVARVFLIISAVLFLIFIRTNERITRYEALILLFLYIAFIFVEMLL
ncbi:MAG: sodium:calcium antiporter [Patescibacteria group bacterium]